MQLFEHNSSTVKSHYKQKLKRKFSALSTSGSVCTNDATTESISISNEPPESRVTTLCTNITEQEEQLLSLGPNYALSPRVDDKLLDNVRINIAHTAYKSRWKSHLSTVHTAPTLYQHIKKSGCPFQRPYTCTPPTHNINLEDNIKQLLNFIINQYKSTKPVRNLTQDQLVGFKSLLSKRDTIHFSVSDKGGEFVLLSKEVHTELTTHHITSTPSVYRYLPPTGKTGDNRGEQPIINTSRISFKRQIKSKTLQLETECNKLWSDICKNHGFDSKLAIYLQYIIPNRPQCMFLLRLTSSALSISPRERIYMIFVNCDLLYRAVDHLRRS